MAGSKINNAASVAASLVEHTAKTTAEALAKFSEKTATMTSDISYIKESLTEIKQNQKEAMTAHGIFAEGAMDKFASKEDFVLWRNWFMGGIAALGIGLLIEFLKGK